MKIFYFIYCLYLFENFCLNYLKHNRWNIEIMIYLSHVIYKTENQV